jgi:hypothetical protein
MKKTRFTGEQIVKIPQQQEAGMKAREICQEHGISDQTFYNGSHLRNNHNDESTSHRYILGTL